MHAGLGAVLSVKCIKSESNFCIESSKREGQLMGIRGG